MKRFRFRLEKVLEVREYYERIAEMKLAAAAGRCALLERNLAENARATRDAALQRFGPGRDLADMQAAELYARRLAAEMERTLKALAFAEAERETARQGYVAASKETKLLTKLRERGEAEYYRSAVREEVKILDDLSRAGKNIGRDE